MALAPADVRLLQGTGWQFRAPDALLPLLYILGSSFQGQIWPVLAPRKLSARAGIRTCCPVARKLAKPRSDVKLVTSTAGSVLPAVLAHWLSGTHNPAPSWRSIALGWRTSPELTIVKGLYYAACNTCPLDSTWTSENRANHGVLRQSVYASNKQSADSKAWQHGRCC